MRADGPFEREFELNEAFEREAERHDARDNDLRECLIDIVKSQNPHVHKARGNDFGFDAVPMCIYCGKPL